MKKLQALHLEKPTTDDVSSAGIMLIQHTAENLCDLHEKGKTYTLCDPFVKMLIDGREVLTTIPREDEQVFNVGRTITSKRIQKNSTIIQIEVLDDGGKSKGPQLILKKSGTVETFMQKPIQCTEGATFKNALGREQTVLPNCIEVDVVWQDERDGTHYQTR